MWTSFFVLLLLSLNAFPQELATYSQQSHPASYPRNSARAEHHRQTAIEINDLAGRIHLEADANALVDKIAAPLADTLPPARVTRGILKRVAHAEYEAASKPLRLIPEQRSVDVWTEYVPLASWKNSSTSSSLLAANTPLLDA